MENWPRLHFPAIRTIGHAVKTETNAERGPLLIFSQNTVSKLKIRSSIENIFNAFWPGWNLRYWARPPSVFIIVLCWCLEVGFSFYLGKYNQFHATVLN